MNIFIEFISNKPKTFFARRKYNKKVRKFRNDILNGSPDFGLLWKMADFIKLCEIIYFYNNNTNSDIFSSREYLKGENGFKLLDTETNTKINVKLKSTGAIVIVEVSRESGLCSTFTFENNDWFDKGQANSAYNVLCIEEIIKIINNKIISLFDRYYSRR